MYYLIMTYYNHHSIRFNVNLAPTLIKNFSCFYSSETLKPYIRISQDKAYIRYFS
uniref:Uncharacterized protein n=1 Tax=Setaria italica TaxID=4555 RepID=K3Y0T8_SETIT